MSFTNDWDLLSDSVFQWKWIIIVVGSVNSWLMVDLMSVDHTSLSLVNYLCAKDKKYIKLSIYDNVYSAPYKSEWYYVP